MYVLLLRHNNNICVIVFILPSLLFSSPSAAASQTPPTAQLKKKPADDLSSVPVTDDNNNPDRFCSICQASFNNPLMAQQHYVGKKHRKQVTKLKLMETYGPSTAPGQSTEPGTQFETLFAELPILRHYSLHLTNYAIILKSFSSFLGRFSLTGLKKNNFSPFLCVCSFHTKGLPVHSLQH